MRSLHIPPRTTAAVVAAAAAFAAPAGARAQTDHLRELAKNRTRLLIVASGPEAQPLAERFQKALLANNDFRRAKGPDMARVVTPAEAEALLAADPAYQRASVVLLLSGRDTRTHPLPTGLAGRLPFEKEAAVLGGNASVVRSVLDTDRPGEAAYRVALYAPDAARLEKLYEVFAGRRADGYRALPFTERYESNRLALFASADLHPLLEQRRWGQQAGANLWHDVRRHNVTERSGLAPEDLEDRTEVYFLDRSQPGLVVPEPAAQALRQVPLTPTTFAVTGAQGANGNPVVVISAPSRLLLHSFVDRHTTLATALRSQPATREVKDLSRVGATSLLILGGARLSAEQVASLHAETAGVLRGELGVTVEPRGEVLAKLEDELALQMARGASDTRGLLQRRATTRYVWVFSVTRVGAATRYEPEERKQTPDLPRFSLSEPDEPSRGRDESDDKFNRRWRAWREEHRRWDRKRRDHNDRWRTEACEWELRVTRHSTTEVRGELQLIDMKAFGKDPVVWSREATHRADEERVTRTQRATVRGHDNRPNSLEVPPATNDCPADLTLAAARKTAEDALRALRHEALLPDPSRPAPPLLAAVGGTPPAAPPLPTPARAKIADIEGQTVTLNVGARHGVRVGDRFEVLLKFRDTRDPDTGRILRTRVDDSLLLVVTRADAEVCDCRPLTPRDAAKLARAAVRTPARRVQGDAAVEGKRLGSRE